MDLSNYDDDTLVKTWGNLKKGLDKVNDTIEDGSFHTVGPKGAAPPSQAGQLTLWFAIAVDQELNKRKIKH